MHALSCCKNIAYSNSIAIGALFEISPEGDDSGAISRSYCVTRMYGVPALFRRSQWKNSSPPFPLDEYAALRIEKRKDITPNSK